MLQQIQAQEFTLAGGGISSIDTTIVLSSFKLNDGTTNITTSDIGTIGVLTLEPGTSREEQVTFTAVTQNADGTATLTGVTRGVGFTYPYAVVAANKFPHAGDTPAVLSNGAIFYDQFPKKSENATITGTWTFNSAPVALSATPATTTSLGNVRMTVTPSTTIGTATVTITSPAVVSKVAHGLTLNDSVRFSTTGSLPTGLLTGTDYYVISSGLTADAFQVSLTVGGSAVNTSGSQSGTHTLLRTTPYAVSNDDTRMLSTTQKAAIDNAATTPTALNPFLTAADQKLVNVQTFTANGTWTKPAYGTVALIQVWGGGGSGGFGAGGATGGGGGACAELFVPLSVLSATVAVTIGAGGTSLTSSASDGNTGGTTSFGSYLSAYGGGGGKSNSVTASGGGGGGQFSAGETGSGASAAYGGRPGLVFGATITNAYDGNFGGGHSIHNGISGSSYYGGGAGASSAGSGAGNSVYGGGGGASLIGPAGTSKYGGNGGALGTAGTAPGGGGGGTSSGTSGAGARGQVTVTVFP